MTRRRVAKLGEEVPPKRGRRSPPRGRRWGREGGGGGESWGEVEEAAEL